MNQRPFPGIGLLIATLVFTANASAQVEIKLKPADLERGDGFGASIALEGDYALIGATGADFDKGAAYLYHYDGTMWVEQARLTEEPEALNFHNFGYDVALRGEYAFVGKLIEEPFSSGPGAVHVYKRSGEQWALHQTLRPHDSSDPDGFGIRLAVSGNWLVVGGGLSGPYMFEQVGEEWIERQSLVPLAGRPLGYGFTLALEGDYTFVSVALFSPNTIYVFKQVGGVWSEVSQVVPEDVAVWNEFGIDIALDGETLVAAADKDADEGTDAGAIYVFVREGETWTQQAKLYTGDPHRIGESGWEVAVRGNTLLMGAYLHLETGVVYRYTRTGIEWKLLDKLQPEALYTSFGSAVALDDRFMMIGAAGDHDGGAVYVYPAEALEVTAPNGGETLALGQTTIITWETTSNIAATDSVQIRLLQDGVSLRVLQSKTINDGSHAWTVPSDLVPKKNYQVRVTWLGNTAIKDNSDAMFSIEAGSATVPIDQEAIGLPLEMAASAYPNPFNLATTIRYGLPSAAAVRLEVYDVLGRVVSRLVKGEQGAGWHAVVFDGSLLPSGVYLYRLEAGTFTQARTMLLVK